MALVSSQENSEISSSSGGYCAAYDADGGSVHSKRFLSENQRSPRPIESFIDEKCFAINSCVSDSSFSNTARERVVLPIEVAGERDVLPTEVVDSLTEEVVRCRGYVFVVAGAPLGVKLCLMKASAKLRSHYVHVCCCSALQLSLGTWSQPQNILKTLLKEGTASSNGESVVVLIDNFSESILLPGSILCDLLDRTVLPKCGIILGTSSECRYRNPAISVILKIRPRTIEEDCSAILDLVNEDYGANETVQYLKTNCMWLCSDVELVKLALKEFNKCPPRTLALLMEKLVLKMMKVDSVSICSLPSKTRSKLLCICKLAYLNLDNENEDFDFQDVSRCLMLGIQTVAFASMKNAGMGLLLYPDNTEETASGRCRFISPMIQEFLAAYYIATEPLLCQLNIFKLKKFLSDSKYFNFNKFYFGIGQLLKNGSGSDHLRSEIHYVYYSLLGGIDFGIVQAPRGQNYILFVYELLDQSQNPDLIRKFFLKKQKELTLSLNCTKLPTSLVNCIAYVIANSGVGNWTINNHKSMKNTAEFISQLVKRASGRKVSVRTSTISEEKFVAQPSSQNAGASKSSSLDSSLVKCIREILHRTLQVFSPIKIKSSSSESSYVSFLACDCLKQKFEDTQIVKFEPIQAFHWLRSPVTQQKAKKQSSRNNKDAQDYLDHMTRLHKMEQVELVIMVAPLPERMYYLEPRNSIRRCVELYRPDPEIFYMNAVVESSDGTFLESKNYAKIDSVSSRIARNDDSYRLKSSQMVVPQLPIPKSNLSTLYDNNSPQVQEIAPMSLPDLKFQHRKPFDEEYGNGRQTTGKLVKSEVKPIIPMVAAKGVGELSVVGAETFAAQESSYSRTQIQRQVAVDAGTVLYSTMPNVFVVDVKHPCPDESRMIKKGGNGAIYSATYGPYEFAVKKTPYRSREIEIHKLLKHPNIVELKCLMFGHQQPEHKRRYFSYHFMSKYSGDLSRMVTNKPELTMVTLSDKYRGNPRLLGSMQGNWKYILKEMLKGVSFMHSKNIIHRDMKASNILIKMFCDCENLLTCTCTYKYSVCIADFDAAVPLDPNGGLPPTTLSKLPTQRNVYQVVPVGTDGYRAPESSQIIVANDVSALDPPLTVKADIWSVGLIMIRMLNGANGPTKQQKLSMLLLYYMQSKRGVSAFRGGQSRFPVILKSEIDKIIGLSKIHDVDSSWMRKAVQCISKCVEVDPERRPSAENLLQDPFLY